MRKLSVLFLLLLFVGQAYGYEYSNRWVHYVEGIESLTFQQGVSPSAVYDGCTDTYLDSAAPTTNRDTGSIIVNSSDSVGLLKFDIAAIPDSAVIHYAELRITQTAEASAPADCRLGVFRMMRGWNESQATWNISKTDTSWTSAGALDADVNIIQLGETVGRAVDTRNGNYDDTWARDDALTIGADSLQHGYHSLLTAMDYCCTDEPYAVIGMQVDGVSAEGADSPKRYRGDVTTLVRGWHSGAWDNFGMKLVDYFSLLGADITFADSENATAALRPELIVYYLYATTSTGGAGSGGVVAGSGVGP